MRYLKKCDYIKKYLSFFVIFTLLLPYFTEVYAAAEPATISSVKYLKTYQRFSLTESKVIITGTNLSKAVVEFQGKSGVIKDIKNTYKSDTSLEYSLDSKQASNFEGEIIVSGKHIKLKDSEIPEFSSADKFKAIGEKNESFIFQGIKLANILDPLKKLEVTYGKSEDFSNLKPEMAGSGLKITTSPLITKGIHNISIKLKEKIDMVDTEINYTFNDVFAVMQETDLSDLKMVPNAGAVGDKIVFESKNIQEKVKYEAYLISQEDSIDDVVFNYGNLSKEVLNRSKKLVDKPKSTNTEVTAIKVQNENKGRLTFYVPEGISVGNKKVVIATLRDDGNETVVISINELVQMFNLISDINRPIITEIKPNTGSNKGANTQILGTNLIIPKLPSLTELERDMKSISNMTLEPGSNGETLIIDYDLTKQEIFYNDGTGQNKKVVSLKRKIKGNIARPIKFRYEKFDKLKTGLFSGSGDVLDISTQVIDDVNILNKPQDAVLEIETIIQTASGSDSIIQEAIKLNAFIFFSASLKPSIENVFPNRIQVDDTNTLSIRNNGVNDKLFITITGKDFLLSRYNKGTEVNKLNYPIIKILQAYEEQGDNYLEITIDKNQDKIFAKRKDNGEDVFDNNSQNPDEKFDFVMLDSDGNSLELGDQIANRIVFTLPKGLKFLSTGLKSIRVINPERNSEQMGISSTEADILEVQSVQGFPTINSVEPSKIATNSNEEITVIGINIDLDAKVYIDGLPVNNLVAKKESIGGVDRTVLTFNAPNARNYSAMTQLLVQNANGQTATHAFAYIKAQYPDPNLISVNPNFGIADTVVILKGDNFIPRNPVVSAIDTNSVDWEKLIGTKVLVDGKDINEYNTILTKYSSTKDNKFLKVKINEENLNKLDVILSDYADSVFLKKELNSKNYVVNKNMLGEIILSDSLGDEYRIFAEGTEDNPTYYVLKSGDRDKKIIEITENGIGACGYDAISNLNMYTIYKIKDNKIIGNKVKVVDGGKIMANIPSLGDFKKVVNLTVENPDKKISTLENAYTYFPNSNEPPYISSLLPKKGSIDGNIAVTIKGKNFREGVRVYFDGIEVDSKNIRVIYNEDKKSSNELKVIVPKYKDISGEISVPVTVINKDGASYTLYDGFTYMKPSSSPKIVKIDKTKGSTNGNEIVIISGEDFRFFEPYINLPDEYGNIEPGYQPHDKYTNLNYNLNSILKEIKWDNLLKDRYALGKNGQNIDLWEPKTEDFEPIGDYDKYYSSNILPKIYFGDELAKIVEFDYENITVITPKHSAGTVDVKVVNNDSSISNLIKYTYEISKPKITFISPDQGSKTGGENKTILGELFTKYNISAYTNDDATKPKEISDNVDARVRFGNITNLNYKINDKNYGKIYAGTTSVELEGGLRVVYKQGAKTLELSILEGGTTYKRVFNEFLGKDTFLPISMLKSTEGNYYVPAGYKWDEKKVFNKYNDYELVRVYVDNDTKRLIVERGYAPYAKFESSGEIQIKTPYYYTIGIVDVNVFNTDGSVATSKFRYTNPSSNPIIISAKPITLIDANSIENNTNEVQRFIETTVKGGTSIEIIGQDFREGAKIFIGTKEVKIKELKENKEDNTQTIIIDVPAGSDSDVDVKYPIIVKNTDGAVASSIDKNTLGNDKRLIYFVYRKPLSDPNATEITPNKISQGGGVKIKLKGTDFRPGIKIILGATNGIPIYPDYLSNLGNYLEFTTPTDLSIGAKDLQLQNIDFGTQVIKGAITVISAPEIHSIKAESQMDSGAFSTEGGEEIKILGKNFYPGVKVYIGGRRVLIDDKLTDKQGVLGFLKDNNEYLLKDAVEVKEVKFVDNNTIIIKTPEVFDSKVLTITVVNADTGMNEGDQSIDFRLPVPNQPIGLNVKVVDDKYIKLYGYRTNNFNYYDVYVYMGKKTAYDLRANNHNDFKLLDTTNEEPFKISRLNGIEKLGEFDKIYFVIKAVNNYGASLFSNIVYLDYKDFSKIKEYGASDINGYKEHNIEENVTVRENNNGKNVEVYYPKLSFRESPLLYFRSPRYYRTERVNINMSDMVVKLNSREQLVQSEIFDAKFVPKNLNTAKLNAIGMSSNDLLKLTFDYSNNFNKSNLLTKMPRNLRVISPVVEISNNLKNNYNEFLIDDINSAFDMSFNLNSNKIEKTDKKSVYYYDSKINKWQKIPSVYNPQTNQIWYKANKLGFYVLVNN